MPEDGVNDESEEEDDEDNDGDDNTSTEDDEDPDQDATKNEGNEEEETESVTPGHEQVATPVLEVAVSTTPYTVECRVDHLPKF